MRHSDLGEDTRLCSRNRSPTGPVTVEMQKGKPGAGFGLENKEEGFRARQTAQGRTWHQAGDQGDCGSGGPPFRSISELRERCCV